MFCLKELNETYFSCKTLKRRLFLIFFDKTKYLNLSFQPYICIWIINFRNKEKQSPLKSESKEIKLFQKRVSKLVLDPRMCPLMETDENLSKLPRTHVLVCGYDQLRDDGVSKYKFEIYICLCNMFRHTLFISENKENPLVF